MISIFICWTVSIHTLYNPVLVIIGSTLSRFVLYKTCALLNGLYMYVPFLYCVVIVLWYSDYGTQPYSEFGLVILHFSTLIIGTKTQ